MPAPHQGAPDPIHLPSSNACLQNREDGAHLIAMPPDSLLISLFSNRPSHRLKHSNRFQMDGLAFGTTFAPQRSDSAPCEITGAFEKNDLKTPFGSVFKCPVRCRNSSEHDDARKYETLLSPGHSRVIMRHKGNEQNSEALPYGEGCLALCGRRVRPEGRVTHCSGAEPPVVKDRFESG